MVANVLRNLLDLSKTVFPIIYALSLQKVTQYILYLIFWIAKNSIFFWINSLIKIFQQNFFPLYQQKSIYQYFTKKIRYIYIIISRLTKKRHLRSHCRCGWPGGFGRLCLDTEPLTAGMMWQRFGLQASITGSAPNSVRPT